MMHSLIDMFGLHGSKASQKRTPSNSGRRRLFKAAERQVSVAPVPQVIRPPHFLLVSGAGFNLYDLNISQEAIDVSKEDVCIHVIGSVIVALEEANLRIANTVDRHRKAVLAPLFVSYCGDGHWRINDKPDWTQGRVVASGTDMYNFIKDQTYERLRPGVPKSIFPTETPVVK
jgi:hypothetical protein